MGKKKQYKEPRRNLSIRLSSEERTALEKSAADNNMCLAEYVRQLIMAGGRIDTNKMKDRRDLIEQIARVGNNINQLTRLANMKRSINDTILEMVITLMKEIKGLMNQCLRKWS